MFLSIITLACVLSIFAHAAASPTKRDVSVLIDNILNNATVNALDQRNDLIVRVDVDTRDVLDTVNFSQKRDDDGLVSVDIDVDNLLNNASISVLSQ
ncbi:hypothetical protein DFJ58DRAFT_814306 [Suillus subalutaceus]|uniref:uncharacterized protein n=1 Tax=Suillus subalutaceus TaxID=48586 RepID=UPI001B879D1D|nr:uncharacterized protein DFJ58DRAFT_814306 [Suillus subalutaceus]KAG1838270.1 hypothetical protein DFJ58DRAFT_814306 [Suillus subalutaceus]